MHPPSTFQPWPILLLVLILGGLVYWCAATPRTTLGPGTLNPGAQRAILVASVFLVMLLVASMQHRQADEQIIGEIEETRGQSRKMVLRELLAFTPSLLVAVGLFILLRSTGRLEEGPAFWLGSLPAPLRAALAASIQAAGGAVFAATIGWTVRILGTLAFRKEAFGTGDIYLIAAIGAVGTAWTALFAFLIGSVLALVGVLVIAFRKSSRAIPFGPWLALGAYVALWVEPRLTAFFQPLGDWLWSLLAGAQTPY